VSDKQFDLDEVISSAGRKLREEFQEIQKSNPHAGERGSEAEETLKRFLKEKLPQRFDIASGVVVGADRSISRQCDVIIYDAMNSPVYRAGPRLRILPRDNVPAVIEVKSKLNKDELRDAAAKIATVKKIKPTPICGADQPVTFSEIITTSIFGCVFAFDSYTSLETLAENLRDINADEENSDHWIDLVVILDKGCIGYTLQPIFQQEFIGWTGGSVDEDFIIPSLYVHLVQSELGDRTLNHFFVRLMSHLTFFRKISAIDLITLLRGTQFPAQTIQGYQYNLKRQLVPAEVSHQSSTFEFPKIRFNLYSAKTRKFDGQMCFLPWQDGAVLTFSTLFDPTALFARFLAALQAKGQLMKNRFHDTSIWTSSVLPLSEQRFVDLAEKIHPDLIVRRDLDSQKGPPPVTI